LNRKKAITIAAKKIKKNHIIAANGYISRDLFSVSDKTKNFYMIGSMGLASSIGLGIAIKNPKKPNTKSIRTSKWKLIYNEYNDTKELYNLEDDPEEKK